MFQYIAAHANSHPGVYLVLRLCCVLDSALQGGKSKAGKKAPLGPRGSNNDGDQTVEQRYQKKTQLEHILLRPDTYSELPRCTL